MATLIAFYNSEGCAGRCDARCHNATGGECTCICGGMNHGVGHKRAMENTRDMAEQWIERWQEEHPDTVRFDVPALLDDLFSIGKEDAMSNPRLVGVEQFRLDGGTQPRVEIDQATVDEYAEAMQDGKHTAFPPVLVYRDDDGNHWLADGFHRVLAARQIGLQTFWTEVRGGTLRDAILYSVGANATHGLRRSNADKRGAVEKLLRDEEWVQWSDREIARQCQVHHETVARVRAELEASGEIARYTERKAVRGGQEITVDTSAIGQSPPEPAEHPVRIDVQIYDHAYEQSGPAYESVQIPRADAGDWLKVYQIIADTWPEALVFVAVRSYAEDAYLAAGENFKIALAEARELEHEPGFYHEVVPSPGGDVGVVSFAGHEFMTRTGLRPHLLASGFEVVTYTSKSDGLRGLECIQFALERDKAIYDRLHQPEPADPSQPPGWVAGDAPTSQTVPGAPIPGLPLKARDDHLLVTLHSIAVSLDTVMGLLKEVALDEDELDSAVARSLLHSAQHSIEPIRQMVETLVADGALDELRQKLADVEANHDGEHTDKVISGFLWNNRPRKAPPAQQAQEDVPFGELFEQDDEAEAAR